MFGKKLILLAIIAVALLSAFTLRTLGAEKTVTANGNAQIDTTQYKFGGASGLFDGSGDYLSTPDSVDWYFGTGDFTVDFWVRFNALPTAGNYVCFYNQWVDIHSYPQILLCNNAGTYQLGLQAYLSDAQVFTLAFKNSPGLSTATWYHLAFARSGSSFRIFQNGAQLGTTQTLTTDYIPDYAANLMISGRGNNDLYVNGWLDEYRVSKGIARWTLAFTPPTSAYTADSYTVLLLHMDGTDGSTTFTDSSASIPQNPDFTILSSKTTMTVSQGSSDTSTITVTSIMGFSQDVTLSSSWTGATPSGVTVSFSQNPVTPTSGAATSTLTVTVDSFSSTGTYTLTVTGTAGATTHTATVSVTISGQPGTYSFNVRADATKITVTCTWSTSGSITIKLLSPPSTTYTEADMTIYEKTTITAGSTTSYSYLKRAQLTITAPGTTQTWLLQLTTTATTYTVNIEVT